MGRSPPLPEVRELAERSARSFARHDMAVYTMALAFRALLALFPFALFLVSLVGFLRLDDVLGWLARWGPAGLRPPEPVGRFLGQILNQDRGGLLSFGIVLALWSVSMGARLLTRALNAVFEVEETRPAWKRAVVSLTFAPGLALAGAVSVGLLLFTSRAMAWLAGWVGLDAAFVSLWTWLRVPVALVLLALVVAAVYRFAPNADLPFRSVAPGAALATLSWALASLAFSLYLSVSPGFGAAYGSLGAAISLLL
jgi:membrane protein